MLRPVVRRRLVAAAVLSLIGALGAWAWQLALERLPGVVAHSLGERASVGAIRVGIGGVELLDVRLPARSRAAWPAEDELRAARVRVVPSLASLWRSGWRVRSVTVEGGYVSALRTREGRLRLLPSLLEGGAHAPLPALAIDELRLVDGALDLHDASVRQPPWRVRVAALQATLGPIELPALAAPIDVDLRGVLAGVRHDGRFTLTGTLTPATHDAALEARFTGVDLLALQPYLLKVADAGVKRGRLDLELKARVAGNRLRAPGSVTLEGLELAHGPGVLSTFAGVPRQAVVSALQRDGRIRIAFTLEGRLDDPAFSLQENLATRVASGLADTLGVSVHGVVQGVGNVVKGLFGR
ncbi:MAG TPA: DUF748 domain-containing protein [Burkholderiaceae bacterium]